MSINKRNLPRAIASLLAALACSISVWADDLSGTLISLNDLSGDYTAQDGDMLTGSTSGKVTIANNAKITLSDATITYGIICEGNATITLVGTNNVSVPYLADAYGLAGIQVGPENTTLTIRGNGSLNVDMSGGWGWGSAIGTRGTHYVVDGNHQFADQTGGNIVIEGGVITAKVKLGGAGIGTGAAENNYPTSYSQSIGSITINGGSVTAIGGEKASGIGKGHVFYNCSSTVGAVTIYDNVDFVDASSISESVTYMHDDGDVTANKADYFTIAEDGDRRVIAPKDDTDYTITLAGGTEHGTISCAETAKYMDKVTVTATPDFGYRLVRLVVKDADDNDVALTGNTFLMPKSNVTVSAVFEQSVHGSTEFKLRYSTGPSPEDQVYETIYDGLTTVNLQQGQSYKILKYDDEYSYRTFFLDNDTYVATIPYSGGTGIFSEYGISTYFEVDYDGESGFYDITMTDVGNGKWSVSIQKTVGVIDNIPDQTYTGSEIKPEPLVMAGSLNLTKGTDYEYSYTDNTNVGTAKVTVTFKGGYASLGSVEKEFSITPKAVTVTADAQTKNLGDADPELTVTIEGLLGEDVINYTISRDEGEEVGEYAITPSGEATQGNYAVTYVAGTLTINPNSVVTPIANITKSDDANAECAWHTLDGRRILSQPTRDGLYIRDGKLVLIKH